MSKYKKGMLLFIGITVGLYLLRRYVPGITIINNKMFECILYIGIISTVIYYTTPKIPFRRSPSDKVEYILQGNGLMGDEIFDIRRYRNYERVFQSEEGCGYQSPTGEIICTKYQERRMGRGETGVSLFIFSVLWTLVALCVKEAVVETINQSVDIDKCKEIIESNWLKLQVWEQDNCHVAEKAAELTELMGMLCERIIRQLCDCMELITGI